MSISLDKTTRFLVVDDFESMRKLVIKNLNSMGYMNVVQAGNGQEALRMLEQNPTIAVVITDWNMPVMSGIELLRTIRAHDKFKGLPVLMITAEIARHEVQEAAEAGVSDFLVKPFTVGGLQAKLNRMMDNLKRGIVAGLKLQLPPGSPAAPAASAAPATPVAEPVAEALTYEPPMLSGEAPTRKLPRQTDFRNEPPALEITADLEARMTKRANILVVDDVPANIDVLVGFLQDDYKVRAVTSGAAALKSMAAGTNLPDLILLDVMMPEMDGFEVCRRLKANPATAGIPVIFLTAVDDAMNVVQGLELGAVDYLTKPANPTVLSVRVRNHLTRSQAFAELQKQNQVMAENMRLREDVERMTAHDLKNPIGGIINFTDMLLGDESMSEDRKEMLQAIGDSAHSLLHMVNLSLDLFKIEQGLYELQPSQIDLVQVVRQVLTEKNQEIAAKRLMVTNSLRGTNLQQGDPPVFHVLGDELLCYSMFGNVIKNAVEAAPNEGRLSIVYTVGEDGRGTIAITNTGAVPKDVRGSFFEKYVTAGKKGGTGLGTYSARLLARVQHGNIRMQADDEKNETTVTVTLPLDA